MGAHKGVKKILIYDASPHPLSNLIPAKCGPGTVPRHKQQWATNMLKQVELLLDVDHSNIGQEGAAEDTDTRYHTTTRQQNSGGRSNIRPEQAWQQQQDKNSGKAPAISHIPQGQKSEGDTSPERKVHIATASPNIIKQKKHLNRFQQLGEGGTHESVHNVKARSWTRLAQGEAGLGIRCH